MLVWDAALKATGKFGGVDVGVWIYLAGAPRIESRRERGLLRRRGGRWPVHRGSQGHDSTQQSGVGRYLHLVTVFKVAGSATSRNPVLFIEFGCFADVAR